MLKMWHVACGDVAVDPRLRRALFAGMDDIENWSRECTFDEAGADARHTIVLGQAGERDDGTLVVEFDFGSDPSATERITLMGRKAMGRARCLDAELQQAVRASCVSPSCLLLTPT